MSDLQRVAGYVERGGVPWVKILAAVAVVAGLGALVCELAGRIRNVLDWYTRFRLFVLRPALLVTWIKAIQALIPLLERVGIVIPPPFRQAVVAVVAALTLLLGALTDLSQVDDDVSRLLGLLSTIDELCNEITTLGGLV